MEKKFNLPQLERLTLVPSIRNAIKPPSIFQMVQAVLLLTLFAFTAFAQFDVEKIEKELKVRNIYTIIENRDGDIFAGTWGAGIWKSIDFGNTWNRTSEGLLSYDIRKLIALNSDRIFAATAKGLYYTDNGGLKWNAVNQINEKAAYRNIVINGNDIYVATDDGLLYKSQNDGLTWFQTGKIDEPIITAPILISENKMLVGTENGLLISEDEGQNWVKGNYEINNEIIKDLLFINETLYITTLSNGIFISTNYGKSIIKVEDELPYLINKSINNWQKGYSNISASGPLDQTRLNMTEQIRHNLISGLEKLATSVEFISSNRNGRMSAITSGGEVLFSNDAGANWTSGSQLINLCYSQYSFYWSEGIR